MADVHKENIAMAAAPPKPTQRLIIKKMVLENFKSYAGVVEIGPFHKCFSSVVGPNGSGKSNVIDALLFVFGRRAKAIRQGKLSELIHNSENFPDLQYCKVSIYFCDIVDKGDDYEVIAGSDIVVSRKADRKSQSTYYVNDKTVRLDEVTVLLKARGIDLDHNRFLILQGEVESIAMMKPKGESENEEGLLEYLEDLIGSNVYKDQITEAGQELARLSEEKQEKLNRVKAAAKEKDDLEPSMRAAVQHITMSNELTRLKNHRWQHFLHISTQEHDKSKAEKEEVGGKMKTHLEEQGRFEKEVGEISALYETEDKEYKKLEAAVQAAKDDFTAYERKDVKFREEVKHAKAKYKKMKKQYEEETHSVNQLTAQIMNDESDITRLTAAIEQDAKRLATEEDKLQEIEASLHEKTAVFKDQVESKQQELAPWSRQLNDLQSTNDLLQSERDMFANRSTQAKAQLEEAIASQKQALARVTECESEITTLQKREGQFANELSACQDNLTRVTSEEASAKQKLKDQRSTVEGYRASMQANTAKNTVLKALMEEKRANRIPGILGRLGDLGVIEDHYDVAITTACGALNHIVVDTVPTGQACAEFLRQKQLGRATFLILEKQKPLEAYMDKFQGAPENVPRLFDLVKAKDPQLRCAFYYALRDTVVAKDLAQATRVANAGPTRLRVVSLSGELIDTSGTMAGGGTRVQRGGMSSKFSADEISPKQLQKEEKAIEMLEQQVRELGDTRAQLQQQLEALQNEERTMGPRMEKAKMDIPAMKAKHTELEGLIKTLRAQTDITADEQARVHELDDKIKLNSKALTKAQRNVEELERDIKALHDKILDVGGVRLKAQKAKVSSIQEEIDGKQSAITKATVSLKTTKKKLDTAQKKIEKLQSDMAETQTITEGMNEEFKRIEEDARKVLETMNQAQAMMESKKETIQEWKTKHDALDKQLAGLRKLEVDLQEQLNMADKAIKENATKMRHWQSELKKLKLERHGLEDAEQPADALPTYTAEELDTLSDEEGNTLDYEITVKEENLRKTKCNFAAIKDYKAAAKSYEQRAAEHERVAEEREKTKMGYDALRKQRLDMFMAGFSVITMKLKEMYQMITLGGDAELELVDSLDPFSEGIVFSVRPPKKSWKNIANLSGGEKTLSSLALVFALHHYKPTPLYVMDEIDAALDFRNVSIVANYIKERTKDAQFVIISLRNNMFELADRLVGIYKTDNHTKTVTINPHNIQLKAA